MRAPPSSLNNPISLRIRIQLFYSDLWILRSGCRELQVVGVPGRGPPAPWSLRPAGELLLQLLLGGRQSPEEGGGRGGGRRRSIERQRAASPTLLRKRDRAWFHSGGPICWRAKITVFGLGASPCVVQNCFSQTRRTGESDYLARVGPQGGVGAWPRPFKCASCPSSSACRASSCCCWAVAPRGAAMGWMSVFAHHRRSIY